LKKTSAYARKRRRIDPLGGLRVISELKPFDDSEVLQLSLPPREAFEAMRSGRGNDGDFDTLAAVVNVSLVRCEAIGQNGVELCKEAQEALMHMKARRIEMGRWGLDYQAMQTLPAVIDLHEQLLELSTPRQMMDAMKEVLRRMNAGDVHSLEIEENQC
jgi:hypothetical protein